MRGIVLAIPDKPRDAQWQPLLNGIDVNGIVIGRAQGSKWVAPERRVGCFSDEGHGWVLPEVAVRTIAFVGVRADISFFMIRDAFLRGAVWLVYAAPGRWRRELVAAFLLRRMLEKIAYLAHNASYRIISGIRRFISGIRRFISGIRRWVARSPMLQRVIGPLLSWQLRRTFREKLHPARLPVRKSDAPFVADRIVLVNSSLAWGGAERQIVNTLCGLKAQGYADVSIICEHLHDRPDYDFYLWHLEQAEITVDVLNRPLGANCDDAQLELIDFFDAALTQFPANLKYEIIYYGLEFAARRPSVVHAWQDSTSIKAGIAALLVGVPTVVLSGRNMAPVHFPYFLPYMKAGYKALATFSNVVLVNNSRAGAADYAQWLHLPDDRIRVLYNGLNESMIAPVTAPAAAAYKDKLGIPKSAKVVGSIFRFYEEKDPVLWIRTAAALARCRDDVVFLLIGTGTLEQEIRQEANSAGISERLFMPGTEKQPALALSVMDVFLLTSKMEGTPNVVIEAQWLGRPVVATDAGGTADTVFPGRTGWIVRQRDPQILAERLDFVLNDKEWAEQASREAVAFAQQRFGMQRMLDETLDAYGYSVSSTPQQSMS